MYYCQHKLNNRKWGKPGNEAEHHNIIIYTPELTFKVLNGHRNVDMYVMWSLPTTLA